MLPRNNNKFIIVSPPYDEDIGGIIALHNLCHNLTICGYVAEIKIFNQNRPSIKRRPLQALKMIIRERFEKKTNLLLKTPLNKKFDTVRDIVVYPESIRGNPLAAKNVVRWLLYKPTATQLRSFNKSEQNFHYQNAFCPNSMKSSSQRLFIPTWNSCYFPIDNTNRKGSCYILRKGKNRKIIHSLTNGTIIDGLPHKQIARIFQEVEYCISYDLNTAYSKFAALCGCKSIIVPDPSVSIKDWLKMKGSLAFGVAYGEDDIPRALATVPKLLELKEVQLKENEDQVRQFAESILKSTL